MLITSLTLSNFTVYKESQLFELDPVDSEHPLILIEGHNGSGKTSILTGIRLALFGKRIMHEESGSYPKYLTSLTHDRKRETSITLEFKIYTLGSPDTYSVKRTWFSNEKNPKEQLAVFKNNKYDETLASIWDDFVDSIIPASIASLFFFDGEKIAETATKEGISALLEIGVQSLLGINILNQLDWDLTNLIKTKSINTEDSELSDKLNFTSSEIDKLRSEKNVIELDLAATAKAISKFRNNLKEIDKIFEKTGARLFHDRKNIEREYLTKKDKTYATYQELLNISAGTLPLTILSDKLNKILDQSEKERSITLSSEVELLIAERDKKIFDIIKKDEEIYSAVVNFINEDNNRKKKHIENIEIFLKIPFETHSDISFLIQSLEHIKKDAQHVYSTYSVNVYQELELKRLLDTIPEESDIGNITIKRSEILSEINQLIEKTDTLERRREQTIKSIAFREQEQTRLIRLIADEQKNETIGGRTIRYAQKAIDNVERLKEKILAHSRSKLEYLMLESLSVLFRKQQFIKSLSVDHATYHLIISDFSGKEIDINRLSAGERQLIVIAILWGLAKASGRPLPLIIDTPLGRLDSVHREHLLDYYFPYASHQAILLATDTEITSADFSKIEQFTSRKYILDFDESTFSTKVLS